VLSFGVVPLGVAGAFWSFKLIGFAASLATVALVRRIAARLGHDPRPAAVLVGLSPPLLAFEVAGAHNDALVTLVGVAGLGLVLERRAGSGLFTIVLAGAMKLSGGIVAPFALLGSRDRRRAVSGAAVAAVGVAFVAVAAFAGGAGRSLTTAAQAGSGTATFSVPNAVARLIGYAHVGPAARAALTVGVAVCLVVMLVRAARGADWIVCAGWSTMALVCGSMWLLPWYATWVTPFAALGDSRRLRVAAVLLVAYVTFTRVRFVPL
jgi:hypothetical protein